MAIFVIASALAGQQCHNGEDEIAVSWAWTEEKLGGLASKVLEMFGHISIIRLWCSGLSGLGPG